MRLSRQAHDREICRRHFEAHLALWWNRALPPPFFYWRYTTPLASGRMVRPDKSLNRRIDQRDQDSKRAGREPAKAACMHHRIYQKLLEIEKRDCAWGCARGQTLPEKIFRSKSTNQEGVRSLTGLICAFRSADFLRWCLSPERNLTHNLLFLFPIVVGIYKSTLDQLFKKACSSGTDNHWETYRSARNKATREIKKAKLDYVKTQANTLADQKCNLSRWWSILRDLGGFKSQRHSSVPPLLDQSKNLLLAIKRKPTFWTTTRTHPLTLKPFLLGRHFKRNVWHW